MADRLSNPGVRHLDSNGNPLSGGKLFFYEPGTTTPKTTYSDNALNTANTNPVILSAGGLEPNIFLDGAYRVILQTSAGVQVWDRDNVNEGSGTPLAAWVSTVSYDLNDIVYASDDNYYISLVGSNLGNDPTSSPSEWELIQFLALSGAEAERIEDIAALTPTDSNFIVGNGTTWVAESGATVRASLGLTIGTDVQAWDADLDTYAANPLTAAELGELQNIGATTISATQWGYLGAADQATATTDNVTFANLTATGAFTSQGIDDNATGEIIDITDTGVGVGRVASYSFEVGDVAGSTILARLVGSGTEAGLAIQNTGSGTGASAPRIGSLNDNLFLSKNTIIGSTSVTPSGNLDVYNTGANSVLNIVRGDGQTLSIQSATTGTLIRTTSAGDNLILGGDANITNLTLSGGSGSELAAFARDIASTAGVIRGDNSTGASGAEHAIMRPNSSASAKAYWGTSSTLSIDMFQFRNPNGQVGSIATSGSGTTYNTSSDYRLKDIEGEIVNSGDFIDSLRPVYGTWKVDGADFAGFLAHEFQEVSPGSVSGEKDEVDEEGNPVYQSMQASSSEVMANVIAELKALRKRVAELESA